jgi:ABC-type transporter Mla subunit MlaD
MRKKDPRNPIAGLLDRPWLLVVLAGAVLFTYWAVNTRRQPHHVQAAFSSAFNLVRGQAVSVDGLEVGKVGSVKYDNGKALVEIGISDEEFWPLHQGTRVLSRWGTTIGSGTRRLDLDPGPAQNAVIKEDGIIPTVDTQAAIDVDEVFNTFNHKIRGNIQTLTADTDRSFDGKTTGRLNQTIKDAPPAVQAAGDLMSDLSQDTFALRSLIVNGDRATGVIASRAQSLRGLINVAAQTFDTFAHNTRGTQQTIVELPPTLRQARTTLRRLDSSVDTLDTLMVALRPGAAQLTPLALQATPALAQLRETVPSALRTVEQATNAAPHLSTLLTAATPFMKLAPGVLKDLSPMVACIRPYAPELGGALVGAGGAHQNYDRANPVTRDAAGIVAYVGHREADGSVQQHGLRATPMVALNSAETPLNSAQFAQLSGKKYAYPRPPGLLAGTPWFMPECGITPDALDPSKDPEAK